MGFLSKLTSRALSPQEAIVACAVTALAKDGNLLDVERRLIELFRDQVPILDAIDENTFYTTLDAVVQKIDKPDTITDLVGFVRNTISPAIPSANDRLAAYRYVYSLAMADLRLDPVESSLLLAMRGGLGLSHEQCEDLEEESLKQFRVLHRALAAVLLGLMVVTADGKVQPKELENVRTARGMLEPIGNLDTAQFDLIFELSLSIHDRHLTAPETREAFIREVVRPLFDTPLLRFQAFHYVASVATSDNDIAQTEVNMLRQLLTSLEISDAQGEAIFDQYMTRVSTIDGKRR